MAVRGITAILASLCWVSLCCELREKLGFSGLGGGSAGSGVGSRIVAVTVGGVGEGGVAGGHGLHDYQILLDCGPLGGIFFGAEGEVEIGVIG